VNVILGAVALAKAMENQLLSSLKAPLRKSSSLTTAALHVS